MNFEWDCKHCWEKHQGNLLKKTTRCEVEYRGIYPVIPDIALFDLKDRVFSVIEVVVSHKPEEKTKKYYNDNNIHLLQVNLKKNKDLEDVYDRLASPSIDFCRNPKCKICKQHMRTKKMHIIEFPCQRWRCQEKVKVATVEKFDGTYCHKYKMTSSELKEAESRGANNCCSSPYCNFTYFYEGILETFKFYKNTIISCATTIHSYDIGYFFGNKFYRINFN